MKLVTRVRDQEGIRVARGALTTEGNLRRANICTKRRVYTLNNLIILGVTHAISKGVI